MAARQSFDAVARAVAGVPFMAPEQGRLVYEHVLTSGARDVLELGTAHGVGSAYMAAAGADVITVDYAGASFDPAPEAVLERAGLREHVRIVREHSSYTWWLKEQLVGGPQFDFVYLDGAKNWTIDGLAVVLIERVLRPGGWLLMDDLHWTYSDDPGRDVTDGVTIRSLSDAERAEPHLRAVFDLLVTPSPHWDELRIQDDWWGWARRTDTPAVDKTLRIETSRSAGALAANGLRQALRAARKRARAARRS